MRATSRTVRAQCGGKQIGGLAAGLLGALGIGRASGVVEALSAGLGVGIGAGPPSGRKGGFVGSAAGGLLAGLLVGLAPGWPAGVVNGIGVGLGAGLTVSLRPRPGPTQRLRWSGVGIGGGLAAGLALGLVAWRVVGPATGVVVGTGAGLVIALVSGLAGAATTVGAAVSPAAVLTRDRRIFTVLGLSAGVATGLVAGLLIGLDVGIEKHTTVTPGSLLPNGLGIGLAVAVACGTVLAFVQTPWGDFFLARCWLALWGRRLPWRLSAFLADAHHRGVLRQVGATYQFRHLELQRRLAEGNIPESSRPPDTT